MKYKNGGFRILQVYDIEIDKRRDFIMESKYAKKLVDKTCFENIENTYTIKLPQYLKDLRKIMKEEMNLRYQIREERMLENF